MPDKEAALIKSIESIVGSAHVERATQTVDGIVPAVIATPASADEAANCLRVCSELGAAVLPAGKMGWLEWGNPIARADVVLSLARMGRVIDYSPPDLTAVVEAGLLLSDFNAATSRERQWLPLDPPGFRQASLGAIAACNSSGALRLGFGTPRDYVIGLKLAHVDGTQSKSGGRVVKNVAGYDMNKLYVGSFGTLAIITEIVFKLRPMPELQSTLLVTSKDRAPLFQLARRVLASELQPSSVVLARGLSLSNFPADVLLLRFLDNKVGVAYQVDWVNKNVAGNCQASVLSDDEAEIIWAEAADFDRRAICVRLSVPVSASPEEFEEALLMDLPCAAAAHIGTGIIRMAFDFDERAVSMINKLRANAVAAGGTLIVEKAPLGVRREVDAWGEAGPAAALMRSIKQKFDPRSILNPGKFVAGI